MNIHGFKQIIKKPTRVTCVTKSLIDIILSNKPEFVKLSDVIPLSIGDHDLIGCVRKVNHIKLNRNHLPVAIINTMIQEPLVISYVLLTGPLFLIMLVFIQHGYT